MSQRPRVPIRLYMAWAKCELWRLLLWNSVIPPQLVSLIHGDLNVSTSRAEDPGNPPWEWRVMRLTAARPTSPSQNSWLDSDTFKRQGVIDQGAKRIWWAQIKVLWRFSDVFCAFMDLLENEGLGFIWPGNRRAYDQHLFKSLPIHTVSFLDSDWCLDIYFIFCLYITYSVT